VTDTRHYLYGVTRAASSPLPAEINGVDASHPVEMVVANGLAAVTSAVDAREFSEAALVQNVEDVEWITRKALAHESVLERLVSAGWTLVPFRFGTIYSERAQVESFLADRSTELSDALAMVEGRIELGLRATLELARAAELARTGREAEEGRSTGAAYLRRREVELRRDAEAEQNALRRAREIHSALEARSAAAQVNPLRAREEDGVLPLLNSAYLVDRSEERGFRALAASLAEDARDVAVRVELTGPWPPYNFVPRELGTR
jgi:hypothetical protein